MPCQSGGGLAGRLVRLLGIAGWQRASRATASLLLPGSPDDPTGKPALTVEWGCYPRGVEMPAGQVALLGLVCTLCDATLTEYDAEQSQWESVCEDCYNEQFAMCERCDHVGRMGGIGLPHTVYRQLRTRWGLAYAERMAYSAPVSFFEDGDMYLCSGCDYTCENCGSIFAYEDSRDECCGMGDEDDLHNYSWRPLLRFHSDLGARHLPIPGRLYMGFEVEMENASTLAKQACERFGESWYEPDAVYFKSDGSLSWSGAEMVTHPMTLEAFREKMPWDMIEWLRSNGARAWHRSNCGLHVHVSRSAFTPSHMWKFVKFQAVNAGHCTAVAGRDSEQWASWTNDYMVEITKEPSKAVKRTARHSRYSAINITPSETIELRYFRPNLTKNGLVRVAEFVDSLYEYTRTITVQSILFGRLDWSEYQNWLSDKPQYATIYQYITGSVEEND
jgi:hypothetical protein